MIYSSSKCLAAEAKGRFNHFLKASLQVFTGQKLDQIDVNCPSMEKKLVRNADARLRVSRQMAVDKAEKADRELQN